MAGSPVQFQISTVTQALEREITVLLGWIVVILLLVVRLVGPGPPGVLRKCWIV